MIAMQTAAGGRSSEETSHLAAIEVNHWCHAGGGWAAAQGLFGQALLDLRASARQSTVGGSAGERRGDSARES